MPLKYSNLLSPLQSLGYEAAEGAEEGLFLELIPQLTWLSGADKISLIGAPTSKQLTLWLRHGAKKIFYISLVRRTGKCIIEMGGLSPEQGLALVRACRSHFDNWFGFMPQEIIEMESRYPTQRKNRRRR